MGSEMPVDRSEEAAEKMLGKRERSQPAMLRMPSMASLPPAPKQGRLTTVAGSPHVASSFVPAVVAAADAGGPSSAAALVPKEHSEELARGETAEFLKACGICGRRLSPGKDTYIYRGEAAFCSKECRQVRIESDERMERHCSLTSIKAPPPDGGGSGPSGSGADGETVAAA